MGLESFGNRSKRAAMTQHVFPPKARLAFRVGITGHRPNRLKQADPAALSKMFREVLAGVLRTISSFQTEQPELYSSERPALRAVSSLAEGTDRLLAEEALNLGYELCCPFPFAQEEFEKDFQPGEALEERSLDRFRNLLDRARRGSGLVTFVLEGDRADVGEAYKAAGRIVLNQSDILIVVWDGGNSAGKGGTADILKEAMTFHVPVFWIDAFAPHAWSVLRSEADLPVFRPGERCRPPANTSSIAEAVGEIVRGTIEYSPPPIKPVRGREKISSDLHFEYFQERKPKWNLGFVWKLFRGGIGAGKLVLQPLRVRDFEEAVIKDWPIEPSEKTSSFASWVNAVLRPHYAWSDKLADYYADAYRSTFVLSYPLAALAVVFALIPFAARSAGASTSSWAVFAFGELALISVILFLFYRGRRRRWHDRWMNYRLLAELIRQLRFLIPLGGGRPFPRQPAHLETYGHPARTWMFWQMRAIARDAGISDVTINAAYLRDCCEYLRTVLAGQCRFHQENEFRSERIEHRLHGGAMALLFGTAICIAAHFLPWPEAVKGWLILGTAGFPAMGAALAGIQNQGEFTRIARRSQAMSERLNQLAEEIRLVAAPSALSGKSGLEAVSDLAMRAAELMVDEVLDWRVVFLDRPLVPPA